jgi:REP element-mobilizing transposase RayT
MTLPRSIQINTAFTPYYHCMSRCVRRAFLCGIDRHTGYDFSHRKGWIESRIQALAETFALDVCAYAVMSNHYHVILHINSDKLAALSEDDIIERWKTLYSLPDWFGLAGDVKRATAVAVWRERLGSISWYMKCINEPLARMANREDGCKGRFWEGRFKSQALLDEAALLKCMAYVDLNPIRAGLAETPATSEHTSVLARMEGRDQTLAPMADRQGTMNTKQPFVLPIRHQEYLQLVDWTGRQLHPAKRGRVSSRSPPIVERLVKSTTRSWTHEMRHLTRHYVRAIGSYVSLTAYRDQLGQTRLKGLVA